MCYMIAVIKDEQKLANCTLDCDFVHTGRPQYKMKFSWTYGLEVAKNRCVGGWKILFSPCTLREKEHN